MPSNLFSTLLSLPLAAQLNFGGANLPTAHQHEDAERDHSPKYLSLATGSLSQRRITDGNHRYPWPVELKSIGHTMASYQRYGSLNEAYFHHGLDIRADDGADVRASVGGKVVNVENYNFGNPAYWEVAILDDEGFLWQYHHIERSSIPKEVMDAFKNKTSIPAGTLIGKVYYWMVVTFGERYHHIHLNVLGKNKEYLNPFEFLEPLEDTAGPEIKEIALLQNGKKLTGGDVSGKYSIVAEIHDLILHDKFVVPPNEVAVSIDGQKEFTVWKFDTLPGGEDKKKFANSFFEPNLVCGDYECRKPVIDLGFSKTPQQVFPMGRGSHELELRTRDYQGNEATQRFSWTVN